MNKIAVFASGSGSNAENLIRYFSGSGKAEIVLIVSNNPGAGVLSRARSLGVPSVVFDRDTFYHTDRPVKMLEEYGVDFIVLGGFLWLIPDSLLSRYPERILNIHPSLLPKYGGKGMYGDRVHRAVVEEGETETGITIHRVNEFYDSGSVVFQATVAVDPGDTPERVTEKVHELEYIHYPAVVERELEALSRR